MDFEQIADELYELPPEDFIARRDEYAAQAKEAGNRELATKIGKLRRPTQAAWLANLLSRQRGEALDGLLGLAANLRDAQRALDGETLRTLSTQRHQLVAAMSREARALARAAGHPVGDTVERELGDILDAALADPEAAEEVRSGRLTKTMRYSGFGPAAPEGTVPQPRTSEPAAGGTATDGPAPGPDPRLAQAERTLAAAAAEAERSRDRHAADEATAQEADAALAAARGLVAELGEQLDAARRAESEAARQAREARQTQRSSARAAQAAQTRLQQAQARLERIQDDG